MAGEACDATVTCSGDAIQCAILRQQKAQTCSDEEFRKVDQKKITELKATLDGEFSGAEYQPLKADSDGTFDISTMLDTSGRFSRTCPVIPDLTVPFFGNAAVIPFSSVVGQLCTFFQWFGYLMVAFAMRRAAEIIAKGLS
ncbi:hypothetical protein FM069_01440 [Pseudomonas mangiferae]|uniref:Uncharacterized protein n=1 Tax=Pseudomonas mangiferae TaxID=2593654 RepID=A0A553H550_9PSED|nr:hypothetical protein FM069_01395 [Pseudomonas mangiferae]TRX76877.1 hypothetical protein FM069_01440 [Pseudomonas mangiferae]